MTIQNSNCGRLRVAFVYDPRSYYVELGYPESECAELADDTAIIGVSATLEKLGHEVIHVPGIKSLVQELAAGNQKDWDVVFNFAEGLYGLAREAQVPALLEAYEVPFTFSDAATQALCMDKGMTKIVLGHYGIPTAPFFVVPSHGEKVDYSTLTDLLPYPLFVKPIAASASNGISELNKIYRKEDVETIIESLRSEYKSQEILVETFLSGREFTVGILGTGSSARAIGVSEIKFINLPDPCHVDFATKNSKLSERVLPSYINDAPADKDAPTDMDHPADMEDPQVKEACGVALKSWRILKCRDAGRVDVRFDSKGERSIAHILEVNPISGITPGHSLLPMIAERNGISYPKLLADILCSALKRKKI